VSGDADTTSGWYNDAGNASDGGGLPRAVRTDQAEYLSRAHAEAEPLDSGEVPVKLVQAFHFDHGCPGSSG
jgi:hypothetical protein